MFRVLIIRTTPAFDVSRMTPTSVDSDDSKTLSSSDAFKKFIQLGIKTRFYICKPLLDVQNQPGLHHFN